MKKHFAYTFTLIIVLLVLLTGCTLDNYDAPDSQISGWLIDSETSAPVPSQTLNGGIIRLVQLDYSSEIANPINSAIHSDGSYTNAWIFSGKYKVIAIGPFYYTDTLTVDVKGSTTLDIKVKPYLNVNATIGEITANSIKLTYTVRNNGNTQKIDRVGAVIGSTLGVDVNNYLGELPTSRIITNTQSTPNALINQLTYTAQFKDLKANTEYYIRTIGRTNPTLNPSGYFNYSNVIKVTTAAE
jgi:hypothetical protein